MVIRSSQLPAVVVPENLAATFLLIEVEFRGIKVSICWIDLLPRARQPWRIPYKARIKMATSKSTNPIRTGQFVTGADDAVLVKALII